MVDYSRFSRIYCIDASTVNILNSASEDIGTDAHLHNPSSKVTLQWLSSDRKKWLIFFDNADDPSISLGEYIPHCSHGYIIITSRNPETRRYAPHSHYNVTGLEPNDAMCLLLHSSLVQPDSDDQKYADILLKEVECLALAIVQAGAFVANSPGMTFKKYLEIYKKNKDKLLLENPKQKVDNYAWRVYTTWQISFQQLSPTAAKLLQICAFWHHDIIPAVLFQNAILGAGDYDIPPAGWEKAFEFVKSFCDSEGSLDELEFQKIINELNSFSLITSYWNSKFSLHPLVQSWIQYDCSQKGTETKELSGYLLGLAVREGNETEEYLIRKASAPHIKAWLGEQYTLEFGLATKFSRVYGEKGWWMEKQKLNTKVLECTRRTYGEDHPDTLSSMANLATTYGNQGQWAEAEQLDLQVIEKRKTLLGEDHPDTLTSMANLAATYRNQGQWSEAEQLELQVMEKRKTLLGEDHPDTLSSMANLAATYRNQG